MMDWALGLMLGIGIGSLLPYVWFALDARYSKRARRERMPW